MAGDPSTVDGGEFFPFKVLVLHSTVLAIVVLYIYTQDAKFLLGTGSLNLTPEERRVFGQLFRQADTEGIGVVTGEVAVKFFEKTKLEPRILGEVSSPELYIRITSFRKGRRFRKNEC